MSEDRADTVVEPQDKPGEATALSGPGVVDLFVLAALSLALRIFLVTKGINKAEYTDGILQLTLFSDGNPYWPPFYSALANGMNLIVGDLERAGQLVSAIVGGLAVIPIAILGGRLGGRMAGVFAGALFLVLPEPLRWGVRVMTDATFLTLFAASICCLAPRPNLERIGIRLVFGTLFAVLATLTRYQGLILIFPVFWVLWSAWPKRKAFAAGAVAQSLWLAVAVWLQHAEFAHFQQFSDRSGGQLGLSKMEIAINYWDLMESYFVIFPWYGLTPGIFLAFLAGLFSPRAVESGTPRWLVWLFAFSAVTIIAAQGAFGIFEFRYMLPLVAFMIPFAGLGLARWDNYIGEKRLLALLVLVAVFATALLLSAASLIMQRQAFGDIKEACLFVASRIEQEPDANVFSNEKYNKTLPRPKTTFWVGREVRDIEGYNCKPGDYVIVSSVYPGLLYIAAELGQKFRYRRIRSFESSVVPVYTDIMSTLGTHGNPSAWLHRYRRQYFSTSVLLILEERS